MISAKKSDILLTKKQGKVATEIKLFKKSLVKNWELYLLLIPAFTYFIIFQYWPLYGVQIAFREFNPVAGFFGSPWVGLQHFTRFFNSFAFERVLVNTLTISFLQLAIGFPIPIILAIMLEELLFVRFKKILQMVTYAPHFISVVVLVGMMFNMLSVRTGIVNHALEWMGFERIHFFAEPSWFRTLFVGSSIWQSAGWGSIIFIAAIAGVDQELYEAARIDGANKIKRILNVTLPCIVPTIIILLILQIGQIMNVSFQRALLMQNPQNISVSEVISTYVYKVGLRGGDGIAGGQFSFSTAIDLFNSVINFVLLLSANGIVKKYSEHSLF